MNDDPRVIGYCYALYDRTGTAVNDDPGVIGYCYAVYDRTGAAVNDDPGVIGYCYALYDYLALEPNQLSLRRGDRVAVISKAGASRGWWKGRLHGKVNQFFTLQ